MPSAARRDPRHHGRRRQLRLQHPRRRLPQDHRRAVSEHHRRRSRRLLLPERSSADHLRSADEVSECQGHLRLLLHPVHRRSADREGPRPHRHQDRHHGPRHHLRARYGTGRQHRRHRLRYAVCHGIRPRADGRLCLHRQECRAMSRPRPSRSPARICSRATVPPSASRLPLTFRPL